MLPECHVQLLGSLRSALGLGQLLSLNSLRAARHVKVPLGTEEERQAVSEALQLSLTAWSPFPGEGAIYGML